MKRIGAEALIAAAKAKGAVLDLGDAIVNSGGAKEAYTTPSFRKGAPPSPEPAPAALAAPLPPPAAIDTSGLERVMADGHQRTETLNRVVSTLVMELRSQRDASPAPIKGWDFKFVRDDKDRLDGIRAIAIR